jgi:hypothetical protein
VSPARTKQQQALFRAEKARREEGKPPRVPGMSDAEVDKMAHKPKGGYKKGGKK